MRRLDGALPGRRWARIATPQVILELLDLELPDDLGGARLESKLTIDLEHRGVGIRVAGANSSNLGALAQHLVEHRGLEPASQAAPAMLGEHAGVALRHSSWGARLPEHLGESREPAG